MNEPEQVLRRMLDAVAAEDYALADQLAQSLQRRLDAGLAPPNLTGCRRRDFVLTSAAVCFCLLSGPDEESADLDERWCLAEDGPAA